MPAFLSDESLTWGDHMDPVSITTIVLTTLKVCSQIGTGIYELQQKYGLVNASLEALRTEVAVISATLTRAQALTANTGIADDGIEEHKGVLEALLRGCGAELNSLRLLIVKIQDRLATCPQIMRLSYLAFRQEEIRSAMESIRVQNSALGQFLGCLSCENTLHIRHALQEVREAIARGIPSISRQSPEPVHPGTAAASCVSLDAIAPSDSDYSSEEDDTDTVSEKEVERASFDPTADTSPRAQRRPEAITTTVPAAPSTEPYPRSPTLVEPDVESILRRSKPYQRARARSTTTSGTRSTCLQRSESGGPSSPSQPTPISNRPSREEAQPADKRSQASPNIHPRRNAATSRPSRPQAPLSVPAVPHPPPPPPTPLPPQPKTGAPTTTTTRPQRSRHKSYMQTRKPLSAYMLEEFVAQRDAANKRPAY